MIAKIQELLEEVEKLKASNLEEVEALRIKYLSKKGSLNALMADFRNVPAEMKKEVGMKLNDLKFKAQEKNCGFEGGCGHARLRHRRIGPDPHGLPRLVRYAPSAHHREE